MTVYQVSWYLAMGGPHGGEKYQVRRKSNKNCKISQKSILQFSEAPLHIPWCFICQKNSRASLIKWLKGYSVIFTLGQEISKQSSHTNRWTPCRFTIKGSFLSMNQNIVMFLSRVFFHLRLSSYSSSRERVRECERVVERRERRTSICTYLEPGAHCGPESRWIMK